MDLTDRDLADVLAEGDLQVEEALHALNRPDDEFLHFPFPALDDLVGGMPPGQVGFVTAFSGNGKTSFLMTCVDRWFEQGKRVYYLGLESQPYELRIQWACRRLRLHPGKALSGKYRGTPEGALLRDEMARQRDRASIYFSPVDEIDADTLEEEAEKAAAFGADAFIIDHIDHVAGGRYQTTVAVVKRTLKVTKQLQLRTVAASQLNNDTVRGDPMKRFSPPQPDMVLMGPDKRMIAHWMLGLYRPFRVPRQGEAKWFAEQLKAARGPGGDVRHLLEPNTMAVALMKSRWFGEKEYDVCRLRHHQGRIYDPSEALPFESDEAA